MDQKCHFIHASLSMALRDSEHYRRKEMLTFDVHLQLDVKIVWVIMLKIWEWCHVLLVVIDSEWC